MLRHFSKSGHFSRLQNQCVRSYQSEKGVYGYRPHPPREFQVPEEELKSRNAQSSVYRWVEAYRKHGHKLAATNPIDINRNKSSVPELSPQFYGLNQGDAVETAGLLSTREGESITTVAKLEDLLKRLYCSPAVSAEFSYVEDLEEREWLARHFEQLEEQVVSQDARRQIAELLIKAQAFENFMAAKFPTVKRYGGEGSESTLAFFWQLLQSGAEEELKHIVVGMPHRGRTTLQTTLLKTRPVKLFRHMKGESGFASEVNAMDDHVTHEHTSVDFNINGKHIHFNLCRNPSHLEAVNPVSMGKTRSKQMSERDGAYCTDDPKRFYTSVLNVIVHGDAALPGQGINQECLNMAYVPHFEIGGTLHLVINNQVGFTTPADRGRSTAYSTDLAKTIQAPVFHVNGDDPEIVMLVTKMALLYQRQFRKDVFVDMHCYRRYGHNELDDPTFTNPSTYQIIHNRRSVPDLYTQRLAEENLLDTTEAESIRQQYIDYLNTELALVPTFEPDMPYFQRQWSGITYARNAVTYWDTGIDYTLLNYIGQQSVAIPADFNVHPHLLKTHVEGRRKKLNAGEKIDWATAEALAIGSLMYQGHNVRLSGEDVGRGTFSHRHAMLVDQQTNEMYVPLNDLQGGLGGKLEVANSILSEEAVLGYEYGMAIDNPNNLIIWEAQFGDFANGAQVLIDNFIASSETKWIQCNGLVLLLPHGYDGAGAEHSSCRIERFLQLTDSSETAADGDDINLQVANPTTPAQYFHLLRGQIIRNFRKPLVVVAPKILLRLSAATSTHVDFQPGSRFQRVIGDVIANPVEVKRVILCSGKHYYALNDKRLADNIRDTAIIRLESLCPFPLTEIQEEIAKYTNAKTFIWSQEEHRNYGAWTFVRPRFEYLIGKQLTYSGREVAATSATGIGKVHKREADEVVVGPFTM